MNKRRYYELDLARVIAMITLPMIHIFEYWGNEGGMANILSNSTLNLLAGPDHFFTLFVAPLFMICLGMNIVFTKNSSPKALFKRGLLLLFIEFCFNIVRYTIPGIISICIGGISNSEMPFWIIYGILNSDILAFAGLFFIVFALLKKLNLNPIKVVLISFFALILNEVLYYTISPILDCNLNVFINLMIGNFIYVNADSTFPLLSWMIFPALGYLFASYLIKSDEKKEHDLWNKIGFISFIILAILTTILFLNGVNVCDRINFVINNNHVDMIAAIGTISITFFVLYIIYKGYYLFKFQNHSKINKFIKEFSISITIFYIIQWIIIGWVLFISYGLNLWNTQILEIPITLICIIIIILISYFGGIAIKKKLIAKKVKKNIENKI